MFPHGATVDGSGHLWVTDSRGADGIGHQVFTFSADRRVVMTLGKAGVLRIGRRPVPPITPAPKALASMRRATSTAPSCDATCSNVT